MEQPARLAARPRRAALALAVAGCGTSDGDDGDTGERLGGSSAASRRPTCRWPSRSGQIEGEVNILAWPGYAEDGSTDKSVDWVTPFEKQTGCQVEREVLRHLRRGGAA